MNNEKNSSNDKRTDPSVSTIRNDKSSRDASAGTSSSAREPQQGKAVDNRSGSYDGSAGKTSGGDGKR